MFTPPATDDQTKMQQQMMMYMTVFMGFMFFKVPAGLCIYFITSSLWGICERKLLPKAKPKDTRAGDAGSRGGGSGGLFAKLTAKPASPNGSGQGSEAVPAAAITLPSVHRVRGVARRAIPKPCDHDTRPRRYDRGDCHRPGGRSTRHRSHQRTEFGRHRPGLGSL